MHPLCSWAFPDSSWLHCVQRVPPRVSPEKKRSIALHAMRDREILVGGGQHGLR